MPSGEPLLIRSTMACLHDKAPSCKSRWMTLCQCRSLTCMPRCQSALEANPLTPSRRALHEIPRRSVAVGHRTGPCLRHPLVPPTVFADSQTDPRWPDPRGVRLPSTRHLEQGTGAVADHHPQCLRSADRRRFPASRTGAGTYVGIEWEHRTTLDDGQARQPPAPVRLEPVDAVVAQYHFRGVSYADWDPATPTSFLPSHSTYDAFPQASLAAPDEPSPARRRKAMLGYGELQGLLALRSAIAEYVFDARGIDLRRRAGGDRFRCTASVQPAGHAVAQSAGPLLESEDPGHIAARIALQAQGRRWCHCLVDDQGIDVEQGLAQCPRRAPGVYHALAPTSPGRDPQLCTTPGIDRVAARQQSWIIEDDCDSEIALQRPAPSGALCHGPDGPGDLRRDVQQSAVSIAATGLRDTAQALVEPFAPCARSWIPQPAYAAAGDDGGLHGRRPFPGYIRRLRAPVPGAASKPWSSSCNKQLGGFLRITPVDAGMHLIAWLPPRSMTTPLPGNWRNTTSTPMP